MNESIPLDLDFIEQNMKNLMDSARERLSHSEKFCVQVMRERDEAKAALIELENQLHERDEHWHRQLHELEDRVQSEKQGLQDQISQLTSVREQLRARLKSLHTVLQDSLVRAKQTEIRIRELASEKDGATLQILEQLSCLSKKDEEIRCWKNRFEKISQQCESGLQRFKALQAKFEQSQVELLQIRQRLSELEPLGSQLEMVQAKLVDSEDRHQRHEHLLQSEIKKLQGELSEVVSEKNLLLRKKSDLEELTEATSVEKKRALEELAHHTSELMMLKIENENLKRQFQAIQGETAHWRQILTDTRLQLDQNASESRRLLQAKEALLKSKEAEIEKINQKNLLFEQEKEAYQKRISEKSEQCELLGTRLQAAMQGREDKDRAIIEREQSFVRQIEVQRQEVAQLQSEIERERGQTAEKMAEIERIKIGHREELSLVQRQHKEELSLVQRQQKEEQNWQQSMQEQEERVQAQIRLVEEARDQLRMREEQVMSRESQLSSRESQLRSYADSLNRTKFEIREQAKRLGHEMQMAKAINPLGDYLELTENEILRVETQLKKTPTLASERPRLEACLTELIEQREFLRQNLQRAQREMDTKARKLAALANGDILTATPPPPPQKSSALETPFSSGPNLDWAESSRSSNHLSGERHSVPQKLWGS